MGICAFNRSRGYRNFIPIYPPLDSIWLFIFLLEYGMDFVLRDPSK